MFSYRNEPFPWTLPSCPRIRILSKSLILFCLIFHCLFLYTSFLFSNHLLYQFWSVLQSCLTLCNPMVWSTPGFPVHHQFQELAQTHVHRVGDAIQPSHPLLPTPTPTCLLLLPLIFPSIRVFSNESVLCIRWPKYWSFSFNISPSNEYLGWISLRVD